MSTIKTKKVQVGTDSTASNNFTIYTPGTPDGTVRIGNGNADSPTEVGRFDANGYAANNIQIGTDATSSNNFTIYQPATPDGTLRIGVGNADSPTEVGQFNANGYKPAANSIPILWAWMSGSQSMSQATWTKIQINSSTFDTTGDLDATNYRYTPSVAGYYDVKAIVNFDSPPSAYQYIAIYRNGSTYLFLAGNRFSSAQLNDWRLSGSCIVYLNGTTDYIELYAYQQSASTPTVLGGTKVRTLIQAHLIQQA